MTQTITIEGTLSVRAISGQYGQFIIGKLKTAIGVFSVRDRFLDQYQEGSYEGVFDISNLSLFNRPMGDYGSVVEMRAFIEDIRLTEQSELTDNDAVGVAESDPIDHAKLVANTTRRTNSERLINRSFRCTDNSSNSQPLGEAENPFKNDQPVGNVVKIDATLDRPTIRAQKAFLETNGYSFDAKQQIWKRSG